MSSWWRKGISAASWLPSTQGPAAEDVPLTSMWQRPGGARLSRGDAGTLSPCPGEWDQHQRRTKRVLCRTLVLALTSGQRGCPSVKQSKRPPCKEGQEPRAGVLAPGGQVRAHGTVCSHLVAGAGTQGPSVLGGREARPTRCLPGLPGSAVAWTWTPTPELGQGPLQLRVGG